MATPEWEPILNKMIDDFTLLYINCYDIEDGQNLDKNPHDVFVPNHDYKAIIWVKNNASEQTFKWLQIRLTRKTVDNIKYYTDANFSTEINRTSAEWENVGPKQWRSTELFFHVTKDMKDFPVTRYGLYGEILPVGRSWKSLKSDQSWG